MLKRRQLLKRLSALPLVGGVLTGLPTRGLSAPAVPVFRDYFKELGVRTFINAAGTYTGMTGSLLRDEVKDAYNYASLDFVMLDDLQDKAGARIAELIGCEAATVTAGAFSAITLGTAGVLSGLDQEKASKIPNLEGTGMKNEVIIQKAHNIEYAHAIRNTGITVKEVVTLDDLEKAFNKNTAMMFFINSFESQGEIKHQEWLAAAKKHGVPTMNDCAADVPPVENLWKYTDMGYDLVCFSGGKGMRGPQSAGLLLGKKDLVAAARLSAPPRGDTVGRGMKVNKEEVLAMMVAVESFINQNHDEIWKLYEGQVEHIAAAIKDFPGLKYTIDVPPVANHIPTLNVNWDTKKLKISGDELKEVLRSGHPSIEVAGGGPNSVSITTWMLRPGQERIVATRLHDALTDVVAS